MSNQFSDAALILIGYGSKTHVHSAAPVLQHVEELRRRKIFAEVFEAFWKQAPFIRPTLDRIVTPRVFVVPLCISEGYFSQNVVPAELGLGALDAKRYSRIADTARAGQKLLYCDPIGTHSSMTDVVLARAREVVSKHPFPILPKPAETALFLAGHGTGRNENSRRAVEHQAALIREKGGYAEVHSIFMEEEPRIADCFELTRVRNLVIVPFFISDGLHCTEDIPVLLGESAKLVEQRLKVGQPTWRNPTERKGKRVWYARSVGNEPLITEVILERVREAACLAIHEG